MAVVRTDTLPEIEIIEIIDDDVDAFGERGANTTIHDSGGPRWVGPLAGISLVALIGYGLPAAVNTH